MEDAVQEVFRIMVRIINIEKRSPAESAGFLKNDKIVFINGNPIEDALDFNFYSAEEELEIIIVRNETETKICANKEDLQVIDDEELKIKHCGNKCVFCFIDQNPKGLRKTIYVKDEDYRFSFLYGNYFTLTNISQKELERIVRLRLSPLYISVHAVNNEARRKLLGTKKDDRLLEKMRYLISEGIEIHTQVVLCPGINDGKVLEETVSTMGSLYPGVRSLAVVPVGLTDHREKLPQLSSVTKINAEETLGIISKFNKKYREETGTNFVFAADEFYLKAGVDFPEEEYYEGYLQYEDGVGMARNFIERFRESVGDIPAKAAKKIRLVIVTGELFYPVMEEYVIKEFSKVKDLKTELVKAQNALFGSTVTVSGLLSGKDIAAASGTALSKTDILLIPSTCLNFDGKFLDDLTVKDLEKMTGFRVFQLDNPVEVFEEI